MPRPTTRRRVADAAGMSLLEMAVTLAVLSSVVVILAPAAFDAVSASRIAGAETESDAIVQAIVGDQVTSFGYVGDVGGFPASLTDLVRDPTGSTAGWNGPYLDVDPGAIASSVINDAFGQAYEYYLLENVTNLPHRLAVISNGPDGLSTNTSPTPQLWNTFAGTLPTANTYLAQAGNADNIVLPGIDSANNDLLLRRWTVGSYAPLVTNVDSNAAVNAAVMACPALYTMTLTSATRPADVRTESLGAMSSVELPQGSWLASITSPLARGPVFSQAITVRPNQTVSTTAALSGLNSAGTTTFSLSVYNNVGVGLDVYVSNVKQSTVAANAATTTYTVPGCAPIRIQRTGTSTVVDSFAMPYKPYLRNVNTGTFTVTVTNGTLTATTPPQVTAKDPEVRVYQYVTSTANLVQVGQVARGRQRTFTVGGRDNIAITDNAGAVLKTITTILANATVTCTSTGCV